MAALVVAGLGGRVRSLVCVVHRFAQSLRLL